MVSCASVSERGYYCVIWVSVLFGQSANCTHLTDFMLDSFCHFFLFWFIN